ncbi:DUF4351 domain-containing protein [Scytonema sp. NUACC26]|uniref:DUF4351 domain-containing protein n=1 Tax=Scytonema sp. NUACC26 TaxID=3140176 RepID=UPI0034DC3DEA
MTRFIHDQFSKDYLEKLLKPYGNVEVPKRVAGEVRQIDVFFAPLAQQDTSLEILELLGKFAATPAIFEPFRNAADEEEICDCLLKLLEVRGELKREAKRNETSFLKSSIPNLWVLTPTASPKLLSELSAKGVDWVRGVYFMAKTLRTAIVAIHQLPKTPDTLWLRILGRGKVQSQAIDELESLPSNIPERKAALELLYTLQSNLSVAQNPEQEDRKLLMRLAPLYQQDREQAVREGEQRLIIRQFTRRFGEIDASLTEKVRELSIEQLEALAEAFVDFSDITDLESWLTNHQG